MDWSRPNQLLENVFIFGLEMLRCFLQIKISRSAYKCSISALLYEPGNHLVLNPGLPGPKIISLMNSLAINNVGQYFSQVSTKYKQDLTVKQFFAGILTRLSDIRTDNCEKRALERSQPHVCIYYELYTNLFAQAKPLNWLVLNGTGASARDQLRTLQAYLRLRQNM